MLANALQTIPLYLMWHYSRSLRDYVRVATDFLWFLFHFFSLGILIRTLFSPWRRMGERYKGAFDPGALIATFIVNTLMRIVGFVIRMGVIIVGVITLILIVPLLVLLFFIWLALPIISVFLVVWSITLLIASL